MYIRQFKVKNYRSLKDVSIGSLTPVVVFYGENDTGKSNLLSFLELVFRQKYTEEVISSAGEQIVRQMPSGFWRGEIDDFSDNFYRNCNEPITFSFLVRFTRQEIRNLNLPKEFLDQLSKNDRYDHLAISGQIDALDNNRARIIVQTAEFDSKGFYDSALPESSTFLPDFKLSQTASRDVFDRIMGTLDNLFVKIPTDRFLTSEKEVDRVEKVFLKPSSYKNWLFQSSLDRASERVFTNISRQFESKPFGYGRVSIARLGDRDIEILVEDQVGLKLPIGRKGTGVQQILLILSYIAESNSPLIGIEELEINLSPQSQARLFNTLQQLTLVKDGLIKQVFITTHSPHIARRDEAQRRGVWLENGATQVRKPSEAEVEDFFRFP